MEFPLKPPLKTRRGEFAALTVKDYITTGEFLEAYRIGRVEANVGRQETEPPLLPASVHITFGMVCVSTGMSPMELKGLRASTYQRLAELVSGLNEDDEEADLADESGAAKKP